MKGKVKKYTYFSRFFHDLSAIRMPSFPTLFWLCHSKLRRPIKSATLKGSPFQQLTSNLPFTKILGCKQWRKLQKHENTKFMSLWRCWLVDLGFPVGVTSTVSNFIQNARKVGKVKENCVFGRRARLSLWIPLQRLRTLLHHKFLTFAGKKQTRMYSSKMHTDRLLIVSRRNLLGGGMSA